MYSFVQKCTVGPQNAQFAVITYDEDGVTDIGFPLNAYGTQITVLQAIDRLAFSQSQEYTADLMR
jgi:hypothetical protein